MKKYNKLSVLIATLLVAFLFATNTVQAYTGIDVSAYNDVNYSIAKDNGVQAVVIKATEGVNWIDSGLYTNYSNAKAAGIEHIGFYHFMSEATDPSQQARDFYNSIKSLQYDIKPCLDIETNNRDRSSYEITNRCLEFINEFENISGQKVMIYSGAYFAKDNLDERIKNSPLWVASYGTEPIETGFNTVVGWQYTETGIIGGVNGYVDVNNFNDNILLSNTNISATVTIEVNNWIGSLQEECNNQGFSNQATDNIAGQNTLKGCPKLRQGANGDITRLLQEKLVSLGYDTNGIDGDFGGGTYSAVIAYQGNNGLGQDGVVGRNTWRSLLGL